MTYFEIKHVLVEVCQNNFQNPRMLDFIHLNIDFFFFLYDSNMLFHNISNLFKTLIVQIIWFK